MSCSKRERRLSSTRLPRAMDPKVICVLSVILVVALSTMAEGITIPSRCQCQVPPRERKNCGYPGISAIECMKAGCCFNDLVPDLPWCFSPKPRKVRKTCPSDARGRRNCGFPGITPQQCAKRGCCFRAHPAGVPWCYYHHMEEVC